MGLVGATLRLARQAEADVRAQWTPVLIVRDRIPGTDEPGIRYEDRLLSIQVENVGRGPAFSVDAWLEDSPGGPVGMRQPPGALQVHRVYTVLAPRELRSYEWAGLRAERDVYTGTLSYHDVSDASWLTEFLVEYDDRGAELRSQSVKPRPSFDSAWWQRAIPIGLTRRLSGWLRQVP